MRRGGFLKGILFWPIEPSEEEIAGSAELVGLVFDGQEYAEGCGGVIGDGDTISDDQIDMVEEVAEYLQDTSTEWDETPILTVLRGLEQASAC